MHDQLRQDIENQRNDLERRSLKRLRVGWWMTGSYAMFLLVMAWFAKEQLLDRSPNEFGDLMAGIFGPLAFLWLVLGYFQQGDEMRQSTLALVAQGIELANNGEALRLQADELKNAVEQHKEMVKATRESIAHDREVVTEERAMADRATWPKLAVIKPTVGTGSPWPGVWIDARLILENAKAFELKVLAHFKVSVQKAPANPMRIGEEIWLKWESDTKHGTGYGEDFKLCLLFKHDSIRYLLQTIIFKWAPRSSGSRGIAFWESNVEEVTPDMAERLTTEYGPDVFIQSN